MATQVYFCRFHNETFEIQVPFSEEHPPETAICPRPPSRGILFTHIGVWRPSAAYIVVKDGTGAAKRSRSGHA